MAELVNMVGRTIGRLTVTARAPRKDSPRGGKKRTEAWWECLCSCGKITVVGGHNLRNGNTTSCGCLHSELLAELNRLKVLDPWLADMKLYIRKLRHHRSIKNHRRKLGSNQFREILNQTLCKQVVLGDSWNLTLEEYKGLVTSYCYYCGQKPSQEAKGKGCVGLLKNGIDRVDNSKGYDPSNCVPCCATCNRDKRAQTQEAFIAHTRRRYEHMLSMGLITT